MGRSVTSQLSHWARIGRAIEHSGVPASAIHAVLAHQQSFDSLDDEDQRSVAAFWDHSIKERIAALDLVAEFEAAGAAHAELDDDGNAVIARPLDVGCQPNRRPCRQSSERRHAADQASGDEVCQGGGQAHERQGRDSEGKGRQHHRRPPAPGEAPPDPGGTERAGKTTLFERSISPETGPPFVNADEIARAIAGGGPITRDISVEAAMLAARRRDEFIVNGGASFVAETVFSHLVEGRACPQRRGRRLRRPPARRRDSRAERPARPDQGGERQARRPRRQDSPAPRTALDPRRRGNRNRRRDHRLRHHTCAGWRALASKQGPRYSTTSVMHWTRSPSRRRQVVTAFFGPSDGSTIASESTSRSWHASVAANAAGALLAQAAIGSAFSLRLPGRASRTSGAAGALHRHRIALLPLRPHWRQLCPCAGLRIVNDLRVLERLGLHRPLRQSQEVLVDPHDVGGRPTSQRVSDRDPCGWSDPPKRPGAGV